MDALVEEVLVGKKGAATRFYREHAPRIRRYLAAKLPDEYAAENILQDVFLAAFDSLSLYRGESSVTSWLLSIARHEVADYYRKRYIRAAVEKTSPLFDSIVSEVFSPEFALRKARLRHRFMRVYRGLGEQYRDVISYRYELGMSVAEIAGKMNLSFKATESLLYRARQAFMVAYAEAN